MLWEFLDFLFRGNVLSESQGFDKAWLIKSAYPLHAKASNAKWAQ